MKKIIFALLFILTLSAVNAYVGTVRPTDAYSGGKTDLFVNIVNPTSVKWKDVQVTINIPELGIYERSPSFSIEKRGSARKIFSLDIPEDAYGYYPVRITVQQKNVREQVHAWLLVR